MPISKSCYDDEVTEFQQPKLLVDYIVTREQLNFFLCDTKFHLSIFCLLTQLPIYCFAMCNFVRYRTSIASLNTVAIHILFQIWFGWDFFL